MLISISAGAMSTGVTGGGEWRYMPARHTLRSLNPPLASSASRSDPDRSAPRRSGARSGAAMHTRALQISFALRAGTLLVGGR